MEKKFQHLSQCLRGSGQEAQEAIQRSDDISAYFSFVAKVLLSDRAQLKIRFRFKTTEENQTQKGTEGDLQLLSSVLD